MSFLPSKHRLDLPLFHHLHCYHPCPSRHLFLAAPPWATLVLHSWRQAKEPFQKASPITPLSYSKSPMSSPHTLELPLKSYQAFFCDLALVHSFDLSTYYSPPSSLCSSPTGPWPLVIPQTHGALSQFSLGPSCSNACSGLPPDLLEQPLLLASTEVVF